MIRRSGRPGLLGMAARTAVVAGTASAVSGRMAAGRQQQAQLQSDSEQLRAQQQQNAIDEAARRAVSEAQAPTAPAAAAPAGGDLMAQLQQLATLHGQGALTDEEFSAAKAKLLA